MVNPQPEQSNANLETPETAEMGKQTGLSKEAWAAVSAIAVALITGAVAIITTLIPKSSTVQLQQSPAASVSASPVPVIVSPFVTSQVTTADAIAGQWSGKAKTASGESYTINVEIHPSCKLNEKCGTISVLQVPCYGDISLKAAQDDDYEFDVSNFDERSSTTCTPGAGEHFNPLPDGRLSYRADWGVQGILDKVQ